MLMNVKSWPTQMMVDKYCKNHAWDVMKSSFDPEKKELHAQCMINANKDEWRHATYEDICKEFSWKSFDLSPNHQTVLPMPDSDSFYNAPVKYVKYDAEGNVIASDTPKRKRGRKAKAEEQPTIEPIEVDEEPTEDELLDDALLLDGAEEEEYEDPFGRDPEDIDEE